MIPPGTKLMSEEERIQTLEDLNKNRREIQEILSQLPLSMKTDALQRRKVDLEKKLLEIEKAMVTFSRKVVYVKDEGNVAVNSFPNKNIHKPLRKNGRL